MLRGAPLHKVRNRYWGEVECGSAQVERDLARNNINWRGPIMVSVCVWHVVVLKNGLSSV